MKFFYFYEDLLTEARYFSEEKFDWVASNMGTLILDSTIERPSSITSLPFFKQFKEWLSENTTKPTETHEDIVLSLDYLEQFLNFLNPRDSQRFMKEAMERFPLVKSKIVSYLKPGMTSQPSTTDGTGKKRGRPPGVKNKPKIDLSDPSIKIIKRYKPEEPIDVTKQINPQPTQPQSEPKVEPKEPVKKSLGRPKLYNDDLTAFERTKYKKEGPGMIKSLEGKVESLNYEAEQIRQRILKIMGDIDKRKKYFGIE